MSGNAQGYGFDAGMSLRADVGYGLDRFRSRGTVTPSWARGADRRRCGPTTACD